MDRQRMELPERAESRARREPTASRKQRPAIRVQPKLRVDAADTRYEREADAVAAQVIASLRGAGTDARPAATPAVPAERISRLAANEPTIGPEGGELDSGFEQRIRRASGGRPMADTVRGPMESAFGADLSSVRIHTDSELPNQMNALAFTAGTDIHFAPGEYSPGSTTGQHVLAHELTHTLQQGSATPGLGAQRIGRLSAPPPHTVQALFSTMRRNLHQASGPRSNAAFNNINTKLAQGVTLQSQPVAIPVVDKVLALIAELKALIPTARSTRSFKKGANRNAALNALDASLTTENVSLAAMRGRMRAAAATGLNTAEDARAMPGLAGNVGTIASTGGAQGASGSYFDRTGAGAISGIFKPESQEGGAKTGTAARGSGAVREVLGYELDQSLGLGVVPATRLAAVDNPAFAGGASPAIAGSAESLQVGSYQQGVTNVGGDIDQYLQAGAPRKNFDADSMQKMAILDMMTLNADRHGGNVMYRNDNTLAAIDQGEIAPDANRFLSKFRVQNDASGWAWADLPESEGAWSAANKQIIEDMDVDAEIDAMAVTAQTESTRMASVTGKDAADTHLGADNIAMMKYGGRLLQICTRAGLTPNETESIYKQRGAVRAATALKTARATGGGEFAAFVSATFFQNYQDQVLAKAMNQAPPAPAFVYGAGDVEDLFVMHVVQGLRRVLTAKHAIDPTINIDEQIRTGLKLRALPRIFGLMAPTTTAADLDETTAPDEVERSARKYVTLYRTAKANQDWQTAYDLLLRIRKFGSMLEHSEPLSNGNIVAAELVAVAAHLNLPAPVPAPAPVLTTDNSVTAGRLWNHIVAIDAFINAHVDDKAALAAMWDRGDAALRQRMIDVLGSGDDQLKMSHAAYILEAIDPLHRMNLPTKVAQWYQAGHAQDFYVWLVANPVAAGETTKYYDATARASAKVSFKAGKVLHGTAAPAAIDTTAEGWTVVLSSNGELYSDPKSPRTQQNDKTQHSSFLEGLPVAAAGMWEIRAGVIKKIKNHSGHYKPSIRHMVKLLLSLKGNGARLHGVVVNDIEGLGRALGLVQVDFAPDEYIAKAQPHM